MDEMNNQNDFNTPSAPDMEAQPASYDPAYETQPGYDSTGAQYNNQPPQYGQQPGQQPQYQQAQYGQQQQPPQYGQQPSYDQVYYADPAQPAYPPAPVYVNRKSKIAAGVLGILLGAFGVHNFYLGYTGKAVAQLLVTLLSCGALSVVSAVWGLIEGIMILTGSVAVDGQGIPLEG